MRRASRRWATLAVAVALAGPVAGCVAAAAAGAAGAIYATSRCLVDPGDRARAANAYARVADRLAKIIGADAPTRIVIDEELDAELEAAMAELMSTPTPAPETLREQP